MGFWEKILAGKKTESPKVSFGRFSDAYKSKEHYQAWDESLRLFEEGDVQMAIRKLVDYLKNDKGNNIQVFDQEGVFRFIILHGSKQIDCVSTGKNFRAESKVAHCRELNIGFLRKAVEYNYLLNYSRFALDPSNNLCLVFDSTIAEASPYKLFYGMKELALQSDKEDDILIDEFESLEPLQNQHIIKLPPEIIRIKLAFIREKISWALKPDVLGKLNPKRFLGALTYVYLSVIYSIDYLIKPEGPLLEILSRLHIRYFEMPSENIESKVSLLESGLKEIEKMKDEEISEELYEVISTFGITSPANHKTIAQFIESELNAIKWYEENKHDAVCISICNYIAGYCLYNFAMPAPDRDLLNLYFEIAEPGFFLSIGFENPYRKPGELKIKLNTITQRVEEILNVHRDNFPDLPITTSFPDENLIPFLKAYLSFIKNLSLN